MEIKKIKITIDGKEIFPDQGVTILDVARQNNIHIPSLCHHPNLSAWGGCRICVVEVDGSPKLVASCVTPVRDGMEIITSNRAIIESRRTILEFLFAEREHNCMFCHQSGDCELQHLAYELQMDHLTVPSSYDKFPMDITSQYMGFDHNRCILCGRCVRACREISGASVLNFINRGAKNLIGFDFNDTREGSTCHHCGVCLQVCPTGAIFSRYRSHHAVKGHGRERLESLDTFCPMCGFLCPTRVTLCNNNILKVEGTLVKDHDRPDGGQLCFKGRFEVLKRGRKRLTAPLIHKKDGTWEKRGLEDAIDLVGQKLNMIRKAYGEDSIFGIASTLYSNENLLSFKKLMEGWGAKYIDTFDGVNFRTMAKTHGQAYGDWQEASWKMIPEADFILVVGSTATQPLIQPLIHRAIMENRAEVALIGDTDHWLPFVSWHLPVKSGEEPLLIRAMLKRALGLVHDPSVVGNWQGICEKAEHIDSEDILKSLDLDQMGMEKFYQMVSSFISSLNPLIVTGEGVAGLKESSGLNDMVALALLKGYVSKNVLRLIVLKPYGNSCGAWRLAISSAGEPMYPDKLKGGILLLSGEEDSASWGFTDRIDGMDFLAMITPFFPDIVAVKADLIIPNSTWIEEDGTYTSLDCSETVFKKKAVIPPDGVRDTADLLLKLAEKATLKN